MDENFDAIGKYVTGKEKLKPLIEERNKILQSLDEFNFIKTWGEMSNADVVALLDIKNFEAILKQLSEMENRIVSLVEEINSNAEISNRKKIEYRKVDLKKL